MEVLEHVIDPLPLLADFERLLAPGGTLVISVPIETGLPILVKQVVRRVAGWRRIGDYPGTSSYTPRELAKSVFAASRQHIIRPVFPRSDGRLFHDHKGFNWRALRATVAVEVRSRAHRDVAVQLAGPALRHPGLVRGADAGGWSEPLSLPRVAVVSDLREERWHAMDLVAEMLLLNLRTPGARLVDADGTASGDGAATDPAAARRNDGHRRDRRSDPQPRLGLPAMASPPGRGLRSLPHHRPQLRASRARGCRRAGRSSRATIWTRFGACSRAPKAARSSNGRSAAGCSRACARREES